MEIRYKVTDKRFEENEKNPEYIRQQQSVAIRIGKTRQCIWKQFKKERKNGKSYFENKDYKVEKIEII